MGELRLGVEYPIAQVNESFHAWDITHKGFSNRQFECCVSGTIIPFYSDNELKISTLYVANDVIMFVRVYPR